jgi:predicted MFS family arabinose efflux permease
LGSWHLIFWINGPIGALAYLVARTSLPKDAAAPAGLSQFDLPGAVSVLGGLSALMFGLGGTGTNGWLSARTLASLAVAGVLLTGFVLIERRSHRPLIPQHTWKVSSLVSGTTVMLGVTGILVGTVFLTSIFVQTALGFSALQAGVAFLPFALAITTGTVVARHLLAHVSPRAIAAAGLLLTAGAAGLLARASADAAYVTGILPGLVTLGLGVGMVFVPVSVTSMAGIPASHAGLASGFLMTGHEVGAALGVAVLSAVATTAGSLASPTGVVAAFSRGFLAAAVLAALLAVFAFSRMASTRPAADAAVHMHH